MPEPWCLPNAAKERYDRNMLADSSLSTRPLMLLLPAQLTDRRCWERVVPLLPSTVDVERMEPPSRQTGVSPAERLVAYEDALVAKIQSAKRPVIVAGCSLGGYLGGRAAARVPFAHLVAISALARLPEGLAAARAELAQALERGEADARSSLQTMGKGVARPDERDVETDRLVWAMLDAIDKDELLSNLRMTDALATDAFAVAPFSVPATVFHGRQDMLVPFACGEELARLGKNVRFVPIETSSHLMPLTHASLVADELSRIVDAVSQLHA